MSKLRTVHINENEWKYAIDKNSVRIYSPFKDKYKVNHAVISDVKYYDDYIGGDHIYTITPQMIKDFITSKLL